MNPVMAADGSSASASRSSGGATADSYIGSLISLTSKSEIRYEGVLYNINTDESSIGLRNVRSYGTEGRKKDGPQVPPSDKIYEYILFRGSDIKDLQVKSSPPIQTPINNDPAIIQSHYSHQTTSSTALPSGGSGSMPDFGPNPAQLGHPGLTFQGGLPLYQPGENLSSWGPSPSLNANGSNHAMPMYWQGLYGTSNGLPPMQQQSLFRPPPGLSVPQSMQQIPYSGFNTSMPTGAPNLLGSNLSEYPFPLVPAFNKPLDISSSLAAPTPPLTISPMQLSSAIDTSSLAESKAPVSSSPAVSSATLPSISPLEISGTNLNAALPSRSSHPNDVSGQFLQHLSNMQPVTTVAATHTSTLVEAPTANLVTPGQLLQAGQSSASPYQSSQIAQKDVEVVQVAKPSSESRAPLPKSVQPPLLPLPQATHSHKPNGAPFQMRHNNYRGRGGRGRGRGYEVPRQAPRFTEDFDFEAMNEKFKKDEVWGHLGMSNKLHQKENEGNGDDSVEENAHEYDGDLPNIEIKPVYSKDDFFDSLSSSTVDNDQRHGRTRFSEQVKIDTETFGDFARHRGGRGGRGPYRGGGGRSRGSSYGRGNGYGYGYGGRGRGRGMSQGY